MAISTDEVRHVARLARLALSDDELGTLSGQLGQILDYVKQLDALDTAGVEPTSHAVDTGTPFRDDVAVPFPDREALLANAPDREGDAFRVPRIIED
jgi:aspartyl-tRNA(Asn)/glutamyl-tRNA(Gln) amidotransferase subunit C